LFNTQIKLHKSKHSICNALQILSVTISERILEYSNSFARDHQWILPVSFTRVNIEIHLSYSLIAFQIVLESFLRDGSANWLPIFRNLRPHHVDNPLEVLSLHATICLSFFRFDKSTSHCMKHWNQGNISCIPTFVINYKLKPLLTGEGDSKY